MKLIDGAYLMGTRRSHSQKIESAESRARKNVADLGSKALSKAVILMRSTTIGVW